MASFTTRLPKQVAQPLSRPLRSPTPFHLHRSLASFCRSPPAQAARTTPAVTERAVTSVTASSVISSRRYATAQQKNVAIARSDPFDVQGKVIIVTGGGRGLGLMMAEGIAEAGGKVYCLDRLSEPDEEFEKSRTRARAAGGGSLSYEQVDVCDDKDLEAVVGRIAADNSGLSGLIAAAGVQQITPATEYTRKDISKMLDINYTGVFMSATAVAKQMMKYNCEGSIVLVGSMSGFIANKGLISPVYNSSKAAVVQLARSLAMEWGRLNENGGETIRVNSLCPGHIITPMVEKNFTEVPGLKETWEKENMMGRLASPEEFKGPAIFLLSNASSFMTGSSLIIDAGHTAW